MRFAHLLFLVASMVKGATRWGTYCFVYLNGDGIALKAREKPFDPLDFLTEKLPQADGRHHDLQSGALPFLLAEELELVTLAVDSSRRCIEVHVARDAPQAHDESFEKAWRQ